MPLLKRISCLRISHDKDFKASYNKFKYADVIIALDRKSLETNDLLGFEFYWFHICFLAGRD